MSIPRYRVRMPPPEAPPPGYTDGTNYYQYACPAETTVPLYQASGGMREVPVSNRSIMNTVNPVFPLYCNLTWKGYTYNLCLVVSLRHKPNFSLKSPLLWV